MSGGGTEMSGRRIVCIHNPVSGSRSNRGVAAVLGILRDDGWRVVVRETSAPGDAERFGRETAASGDADIVVVAGGDGTVNEAANGLGGADVPIAILPVGTANVLALELGLGRSPVRLAATIAHGRRRWLWPGTANGRLFLAMASCGFDGRVMAGLSLQTKRWAGKGAYVLSGARTWLTGDIPTLTVTTERETVQGGWIIVTNTRRYAGRFLLAPEADPFEPGLHVVVLPARTRWDLIRHGSALLLGRVSALADVSVMRSREIRIEGPDGEPFELDGDIAGTLPLEIRAATTPLTLLT